MKQRFVGLCVLVVAVATLMVLTGHGPHVVGYLPFLILFACPLLHMFMHSKHGAHGKSHKADLP
jgi:Flp pilus assembly protein TadB